MNNRKFQQGFQTVLSKYQWILLQGAHLLPDHIRQITSTHRDIVERVTNENKGALREIYFYIPADVRHEAYTRVGNRKIQNRQASEIFLDKV